MQELHSQSAIDLAVDYAFDGSVLRNQTIHAPAVAIDPVSSTLSQSSAALLDRQAEQGYWVFDLEADVTIPAEYLFLQYFLDCVDHGREARLAEYILSRQLLDGSWPLYEGGPGNISATVKAYFALKLAGKDPDSPPLLRARDWILAHGGAENANVFTRITLAIFGQIPWHTVPAMPPEMVWLPGWFLFNLNKVSYWSRCVIYPLLILFARQPVHRLRPEQQLRELFIRDPQTIRHIDKYDSRMVRNLFVLQDRLLKHLGKFIPGWVREASLRKIERWTRDHMRGAGGNGGIFPAMANAVMALHILGHDKSDADMARGLQAIEDLVLENPGETYVQPCVSPVWDTCLSINALSECGIEGDHPAVESAVAWLFDKQVFIRGDWAVKAPELDSGGWAFQYENEFYPDVDDTSMVIMAMLRAGVHKDAARARRMAMAVNWVIGMQNSDGGWGAFDINNHYEYLNNIPFADHGALIDPSTADLTGRCIEMLAMLGYDRTFPPIARGLEFLRRDQKESGAWYGRWGVNYVYGTWAVLVGLGALGEDPNQPYIRKAVHWLKSVQNSDGGWGETCGSYDDPSLQGRGESTASQTAWALLGLLAAGELNTPEVERGIHYLVRNYEGSRGWREAPYTGTGFPRVFYLRYHGYSHYFPLWALGVYRNLKNGIPIRQATIRPAAGTLIHLGPLPACKW